METKYDELTVGEIVANDFRTAEVFKKAGIDFCCGGKKSLELSCSEKSIDKSKVIDELMELNNLPMNVAQNYKEWELDFLCDYIVNTHHRFVTKYMPEIMFYNMKIASVHGNNHPELFEIEALFAKIKEELTQHLDKEEKVLFPAIKELLSSQSQTAKATIKSEIERMNGEHEFAGGAMDKINDLSKNYALPVDACNTYKVAFSLLKQFEDDLHIHVHLENNILFPRALSL